MTATLDCISIHARNVGVMITLDRKVIRTKIGMVAKEMEIYARYGIKNAIVIK